MSTKPDILIVGAGIVGAACAAEFSRAGLKVLVLERGPIGGGTTGAAMGHLVVMDDSPAQFAITSYSRRLWHELTPELPADVEYDPCGTLWVAADEQEMARSGERKCSIGNTGRNVEVLDACALAKAEPNLRQGLVGGLRVLDDAVLYPPCAAVFSAAAGQGLRGGGADRCGSVFPGCPRAVSILSGRHPPIRQHRSQRRRTVVAGPDPRSAGAQTQRPPGHHRALSRVSSITSSSNSATSRAPTRWRGFGGLQHPAAQDRSNAHRLLAPIRGGGNGN